MRHVTTAVAALVLALTAVAGCGKQQEQAGTGTTSTSGPAPGNIKIGFVVKQPEEPWFQNEWKFAQQAADKDGFELIKIGAPDGAKVLASIDNLGAQGAQGMIICTPDVRMGPAIL